MKSDTMVLLDNMDRSINLIESNVRFIKDQMADGKLNESLHDAYLNVKDCFELYVMARALPNILTDEILKSRDNGDMV